MPPTRPLRAGLIGLSANAVTNWASGAHLPALLTAAGKEYYTIAALCNSSTAAAEAAIKKYELPSSTKAYGDPESLAADDEIDVVICNTRVDKHLETVMPSVKKGKMIYVEWPVASNVREAEELQAAAKRSGSRIAVGLQGRWAAPILALKSLVASGSLGNLLSSDVRAYGGVISADSLPPGLAYFADRKVGGNPITIGFAHAVDFVQAVTGDLAKEGTHARMQLQRPDRRIRHAAAGQGKEDEIVKSDVPDLVSVHGPLVRGNNVADGATLSFYFRIGAPFPSDPDVTWSLNFEKGEVKLTSWTGAALQATNYSKPVTIQVQDHDGEVKDVPWDWTVEQKEIPATARSVQVSLYAFASGDESQYVSLESALARAKQIDGWLSANGFPV